MDAATVTAVRTRWCSQRPRQRSLRYAAHQPDDRTRVILWVGVGSLVVSRRRDLLRGDERTSGLHVQTLRPWPRVWHRSSRRRRPVAGRSLRTRHRAASPSPVPGRSATQLRATRGRQRRILTPVMRSWAVMPSIAERGLSEIGQQQLHRVQSGSSLARGLMRAE